MASIDPQSVALDPEAAATLADQGLRYDSVRSDSDGFPHYLQAMNRDGGGLRLELILPKDVARSLPSGDAAAT